MIYALFVIYIVSVLVFLNTAKAVWCY